MSFGHRSPAALRFAAYSAAIVDLAIGAALIVIGFQQGELPFQIAGAVVAASFWIAPWLLLAVRYEIVDGALRVRRGPIARRIPLEAIDEVIASTESPKAALVIRYRGVDSQAVEVVQPDDPAEFLRHLRMGARQLEPAPDGGLRRAGR